MTCHIQIFWHVFYLRHAAICGYVERKGGRTGRETAFTGTDACIAEFDLLYIKILFHY
jgi:hypothetical protein